MAAVQYRKIRKFCRLLVRCK